METVATVVEGGVHCFEGEVAIVPRIWGLVYWS